MSYRVKEIFYTLQGEGHHAGTPAVFIRFVGCNLWSGLEEHRERDAERNGAECPKWCDTDFVGGESLTAAAIAILAASAAPGGDGGVVPLVVFTGGEPLLQIDAELIAAVRERLPNAELAVETNGTVEPRVPVGARTGLDWICVSPKVPVEELRLVAGHELKVVFPAYAPIAYASITDNFKHRFVSAEAETTAVGKSVIVQDTLKRAAEFCMRNPEWKLTVQTHKLIGVP